LGQFGASPAESSPQVHRETVLRFPAIRLKTLYRVAEISHARGLLSDTKLRMVRFLTRQRLDPKTGRIEGRWGTDQVDGGMSLAERYAYVHDVGEDRYWDDLKGVFRAGFAEQVVRPAPGRRAVYALCLRADAIPNDLPEDVTLELRVWDLPEAEDPYEDARYGRLADAPAVLSGEPVVGKPADPKADPEALAAQLSVDARWEHPVGSRAAAVAASIYTSAKAAGAAGTPDLRCAVVAGPDRAAAMEARVQQLLADGKAFPLYAKAGFPLSGSVSTGSRGLGKLKEMGQAKARTTPSAAPGKAIPFGGGDHPAAVADRVLRRAWHAWRAELGHRRVILSGGTWDELGRWHSGSAWSDLHRAVRIALRRSTESELVEVLSASVAGADDVARLAAWRLWRLVNSRQDAHGYGRRREVPQAAHVTKWDQAGPAERDRIRAELEENRATAERLEQARREQAAQRDAEQDAQYRRWRLGWTRESERVHQDEHGIRQPDSPTEVRSAEASHAAALAKARAQKRARGRDPR
jgi:hypothetical protein